MHPVEQADHLRIVPELDSQGSQQANRFEITGIFRKRPRARGIRRVKALTIVKTKKFAEKYGRSRCIEPTNRERLDR